MRRAGTGRGRPPRSGCTTPAKRPGLPGTGSAPGKPCCAHRTTTRTAADFLLDEPATDPEMTVLSAGQHDTFAAAVALFDTPVQAVSIPYEGTTLPAYLFLVDDSGAARPTIIYNSGYDSTREESYFAIAAAALRRGYNVLAFEHRVAALILDDGIHDFHAAFAGSLPPFIGSWIADGRDDVAVPVLTMLTAVSTQLRWGLRNGMWVFGAGSFADLIRRARDYTLDGIAHQVVAPTLIMDPENDRFLKGQPQLVQQALTGAPTTLVTLTSAEGAGEHTHAGGLGRAHQVMFDWLDATLAA